VKVGTFGCLCVRIFWVLPEGGGISSGMMRGWSSSKWVWSVVRMVRGSDVTWLVVGSRIVLRLGWSLALGGRPADDFLFWWYRLALFLV
jgi:hypothetical protein